MIICVRGVLLQQEKRDERSRFSLKSIAKWKIVDEMFFQDETISQFYEYNIFLFRMIENDD